MEIMLTLTTWKAISRSEWISRRAILFSYRLLLPCRLIFRTGFLQNVSYHQWMHRSEIVLVYKNIVILLRRNTGMENYHLMCGTQFCKLSSLLSHHFQLYAKKIAWNYFDSGRFNLFWEEVLLSSDATLWQYPNPPGNLPVWAAQTLRSGLQVGHLAHWHECTVLYLTPFSYTNCFLPRVLSPLRHKAPLDLWEAAFEVSFPRRCPAILDNKTWNSGYKELYGNEVGQWEIKNRGTFCTQWFFQIFLTTQLTVFVMWL